MLDKWQDLKTAKGVAIRVDGDDRDVTVNCWIDRFVNDYLIKKHGLAAKVEAIPLKENKEDFEAYKVLLAKENVFPIKDPLEFWDTFIEFMQDVETKKLMGGKGLFDNYVGIDYKSLLLNPEYELVNPIPPMNKLKVTGNCAIQTQAGVQALANNPAAFSYQYMDVETPDSTDCEKLCLSKG